MIDEEHEINMRTARRNGDATEPSKLMVYRRYLGMMDRYTLRNQCSMVPGLDSRTSDLCLPRAKSMAVGLGGLDSRLSSATYLGLEMKQMHIGRR